MVSNIDIYESLTEVGEAYESGLIEKYDMDAWEVATGRMILETYWRESKAYKMWRCTVREWDACWRLI